MKRRKSIRLRKQLQEKVVEPATQVVQTTKRDRRLWPLVSLVPLLLILAALWRIIQRPLEGPYEDLSFRPTAEDDLERIEGIGPNAAGALRGAGIRSFAQLANTDVEHLKSILRSANLRSFDPGTWPEQAQLAARGDWESGAALQGERQGGRRGG